MTNPRVSVFMPVYNGQLYLKEAIESVLAQAFSDFEFIIINDGSTDQSAAMIESYRDPRIRRVENASPSGLMRVRNQGLHEAGGEYIATIDCDDIWLPQRLQKQVEFMDAHPSFSLVGSRAAFMDEKSEVKGVAWRYGLSPKSIPSFLIFGNYFIHSSILIRRSMIPFEGYQASTAEDYDLWVRMSRFGLIWSLPDILVKYRVHVNGDTYRQAVLANRTQQQVRKIQLDQIRSLGVDPTEKEMDIHDAINNKEIKSLLQLKMCSAWLFKLIDGNKKANVYDPRALMQTVVERWLISCFSVLRLGVFRVVCEYFSLRIPKAVLFITPFHCFLSFLRYLKNKDLGKLERTSL